MISQLQKLIYILLIFGMKINVKVQNSFFFYTFYTFWKFNPIYTVHLEEKECVTMDQFTNSIQMYPSRPI